VCKFFQMVAQSVFGQRRVMRMSTGSVVSRKRVWSVSYICLLYVFIDSFCPSGVMYAESIASTRMYSMFASILFLLGGFMLGLCRSN
jgi:hypothetical protein